MSTHLDSAAEPEFVKDLVESQNAGGGQDMSEQARDIPNRLEELLQSSWGRDIMGPRQHDAWPPVTHAYDAGHLVPRGVQQLQAADPAFLLSALVNVHADRRAKRRQAAATQIYICLNRRQAWEF